MKSLQEKLVIEQRNLLSLKSELLNLKSQAVGDFTKTPEYATIMSSISDINKINQLIASEKAAIIKELIDIADGLDYLEGNIQANSIITAGKGCCTEITITDRSPYTLTGDLQSYNMSCTVLSISAPRQALLPGMAVLFMDEYLDYFGNPASGIKMGIISSYTEATSALTCRMVTRWEAVEIGNIIMSKETAESSANNARHPELVVFTPQLLPVINDGIFVKTPHSAIFVKQTYTPKTITGGNIYIQSNEPTDPDCVWIDTNGIDLIIE
jgi:hypothetical protein